MNRREFLRLAGMVGGAALLEACGGSRTPLAAGPTATPAGEPTAEPTATAQPTQKPKPTLSETEEAIGTPVQQPEVGVEPTQNPRGAEQTVNLEANLDNWLSGAIVVSDEDRFSEWAGPARYGDSSNYRDYATQKSSSYHVYLLGWREIDGAVVAFGGFESGTDRYFIPFDLGNADGSMSFAMTYDPKRQLAGNNDEKRGYASLGQITEVLNQSTGRSVVLSTGLDISSVSREGWPQEALNTLDDIERQYGPSRELYDYVHGKTSSIGFNNLRPDQIDPDRIPRASYLEY